MMRREKAEGDDERMNNKKKVFKLGPAPKFERVERLVQELEADIREALLKEQEKKENIQ